MIEYLIIKPVKEERTKTCTNCKIEKPLSEFYRKSQGRTGYRNQCKKCMNYKYSKYYEKNKEHLKNKSREYYWKDVDKSRKKLKEYKKKNPNWFSSWVERNKEHRQNYIREYNRQPLVKIHNNLRSRLYEICSGKYEKPNTENVVGCSFEELKRYLELQFVEGMNWDNYGKWHIDHFIPLSSAKTEEEVYSLFHYTNLQPLWAEDNMSKSNKMPE